MKKPVPLKPVEGLSAVAGASHRGDDDFLPIRQIEGVESTFEAGLPAREPADKAIPVGRQGDHPIFQIAGMVGQIGTEGFPVGWSSVCKLKHRRKIRG